MFIVMHMITSRIVRMKRKMLDHVGMLSYALKIIQKFLIGNLWQYSCEKKTKKGNVKLMFKHTCITACYTSSWANSFAFSFCFSLFIKVSKHAPLLVLQKKKTDGTMNKSTT